MTNCWLLWLTVSTTVSFVHHVTSQVIETSSSLPTSSQTYSTSLESTTSTSAKTTDGKVRLIGGNSTAIGRLEVYYNGQWGTVCDDGFSHIDARVVCNSLGFGYRGRVIGNAYGPGTGRIWLDDVQCAGNETSIANCSHGGWGSHDCGHYEDVSVSCGSSPQQYDGTVRLIGSNSTAVGRLEVYYAGQWGTVCYDMFTYIDAGVVCNSLGFGYESVVIGNAYGPGTGPIWLDDVQCVFDDTSIANCTHRGWGVHNCRHSKDVSVSCVSSPVEYDAKVRLSGGNSTVEGRLEVYYAGQWGTVCDDWFTYIDARIVCNSLGFGYKGAVIGNLYGPGTGPIWLDDVRCEGDETSIAQCLHNGWGTHNCRHSKDVSVSCVEYDGKVRLSGGNSTAEGRLEVYYRGQWGTVCDDMFTYIDARVVCNSLGFGYNGTVIGNRYGSGTGPIWLDDVRCVGNETSIANCRHRGWGSHDCGHYEDVSISCGSSPKQYDVRLSEGNSSAEGRLEVYYSGQWGTVCDDMFTYIDAGVVCNSLGFGYNGSVIGNTYGPGSGRIWLDDVRCVGDETSIANCSHSGWGIHNCQHYEDVSVACGSSPVQYGPLPNDGNFFIIADSYLDNIYQVDATAGVIGQLLPFGHAQNLTSVTYDPTDKLIYWADYSAHTINRYSLLSNNNTVIYRDPSNAANYVGLTIDVGRQKLYYTDEAQPIGNLGELSTDGTDHRFLTFASGSKPRGVAIDDVNRIMYWTDWSVTGPAIYRSSLVNPKARETLVSDDLVWPIALAVDFTAGVMYWGDAYTNTIEAANTDGSGRHVIPTDNRARYYAFTFHDGIIYYTNWNSPYLGKVNVSTNSTTIIPGNSIFRRPTGIVFVPEKSDAFVTTSTIRSIEKEKSDFSSTLIATILLSALLLVVAVAVVAYIIRRKLKQQADKPIAETTMDVFSVSDGHSAANDRPTETPTVGLIDYDYPALPAAETVYSEPENESPPSPSATVTPPIETGKYSTLEPSTRESPPAPVVYDELTQNEYVNTNIDAAEVTGDDASLSDHEMSANISRSSAPPCSAVDSVAENESQPSPSVDSLSTVERGGSPSSTGEPSTDPSQPDCNDTNTTVTSAVQDEWRSESETSSDDGDRTPGPYSQLESSTRDQQPPPVYDRLAKHYYAND